MFIQEENLMNNYDDKYIAFIERLLDEEHTFLTLNNPKDTTMPTKIIALYEEVYGDENTQSNNQ